MKERYADRVRAAWRALDEARTWRSRVDDAAAELRVDDARSDLLRVLSGQRPVPPEVREAQRRIDEWCEDNPGPVDDDPALMAQMEELHARYYAAEEAARQRYEQDLAHEWEARRRRTEQRERDLHRDVEALRRLRSGLPPDEEDPVTGDWFDARRAQVWGVIQPDGTVVAKGFVGDETADEDQAVHRAGSLAYYSPERGWTNAATGHPAARGPAPPPASPTTAAAEVGDAEREADRLARKGAPAAEIDAADDETERLHRAARRPDLADLRRGRWYDEKPITATSTGSTGGTGMASAAEVRAAAMAAIEKANEGLGASQHSLACLQEAQGGMTHATEGSGKSSASEATGLLAQAVASLEEVNQQVSAAISASETFANEQ